ncbi:sulfate abc transporter atp-binding protein : Sulfate/thiosulfate import ATP-binding protein CysA OS=Planctomyces limnophilus (strain ATCC 43296 / DSM 3776 / IFAM 1008 / 290) GN=cysA PE=3 SV=1: ABC_tran: TOBE_3 [Gemmataceae bacterium]|nr:sulfate abc transporter atp-binding protein : Sulfate/thiosulfate import ATP-binding protein CysA OS=Planctomyces limnophilus (strain ATCC 43296 / DSM 3776 / IFAM 1008 / 290) GN=cysA PE=3 SV=1: ABC_tran: TOBE_3 [Gemmataceae bacterium]VTU02672.1 sulfate abc transporter atp-binding protein : Sulfate/thiosulfate import ATP-binding protein CysA OS=Planctomyces limnophilus (strain ATCC 43296 / DSM 3776 / IFAM 1008 / 290) GN=cysA PE=3 SV=1: ABC_tran: TOBE_3 [Gemmataceae bacterium]
MSITAQNVSKRFGDFVALDNVSVECPAGQLVALLGPSGSGKTTLLRIIAGLEEPDTGSVLFKDDDVTRHSAKDRKVGFVFQHYALFKHMTVFENVAFGLRVRKAAEDKVQHRVMELLRLVRLEEKAKHFPGELSGGQRQRIALVRALAPDPEVLLLDEPFGALDAKVRAELRSWLRRFHDEFHVTSIFVTHDQEEAFEVADQVVVMNKGKVEQVGTPIEVFEHPATAFVMDFLGNVNKLPVRVEGGKALLGNSGTVELPTKLFSTNDSGKIDAYIRPHELDISRTAEGGNCMIAKVLHINPAGSVVKVRLMAEDFGLVITVDVTPDRYRLLTLKPTEMVYVTPKSGKIFDGDYAI